MATETVVGSKGIYFITFSCYNWLPLIDAAGAYTDVYNFFDVLKQKGHCIVDYVIMPNHVHLLLHYCPVEWGCRAQRQSKGQTARDLETRF